MKKDIARQRDKAHAKVQLGRYLAVGVTAPTKELSVIGIVLAHGAGMELNQNMSIPTCDGLAIERNATQ